MKDRIVGVFKLDPATFEAIEADPEATKQAAIVVLIAALLGAVGAGISTSVMGGTGGVVSGFVGTIVTAFLGWILWSGITLFVGTKLFGGQATMGEMLRVIGYAYAPQWIAIIPLCGGLVGFVWTIAAVFIAIRQGLDLSNGKTVATILVGVLAYIVLAVVIGLVTGGGAAISEIWSA